VPGPFDTTTRYLVETYPVDWLSFLGFDPAGPVEVVDANLTAVSAEVDKVVRVGGTTPWLVHLEFQSSYDATIGERLLRYNAMLHLESRLAVASVLVCYGRQRAGRRRAGRIRSPFRAISRISRSDMRCGGSGWNRHGTSWMGR
jgi:hypothetical protein